MNRFGACPLALLFVCVGCGARKTVETSATPTSSPVAAQANLPQVPPDLKTDAFAYYGLGSVKPKNYDLTISSPTPWTSPLASTIRLIKVQPGKAIYEEKDSGPATDNATQELSLQTDGFYVDSMSPQVLKTPHLMQLPSKLTPGTTWTVSQSFAQKGASIQETLHYKVVGAQSVSTPGGKFDALYISGDGAGSISGRNAQFTQNSWYVKDFGLVKQVVQVVGKGVDTKIVQVFRN
jgi:hypothetical protein